MALTAQQKKTIDRAISTLEALETEIEEMRDDLQNGYDDKSERWQESDKGEKWQEVLNLVESAVDSITSAKDGLVDVKDGDND